MIDLPPEITSRVAICSAISMGLCSGRRRMNVANRSDGATAPIWAR